MDGEKNIMAEGKSSSDFAAIVTSPHSEKAFSRALPAQKAPHEVGDRLSKNSLAPSGRGLRPQAVGERASRRHEGFGQRRGSLPPALRVTSLPEGGFLTRRPHEVVSWPSLRGLRGFSLFAITALLKNLPYFFKKSLHRLDFRHLFCYNS